MSGPSRKAVRRNVSVLANPVANSSGGTLCFTMANVAPRPNDFQACASSRPTKIQVHGGTTPTSNDGARNHSTKPSVDASPKAVSAVREPMRSESAPPG